jgi:O-methyltransferase
MAPKDKGKEPTMSAHVYQSLVSRYTIISDQIERPALAVVLRELEQVIEQAVPGDIVEFGCYIGTTSLFMRRLLNHGAFGGKRQLYAYDSFEGLPEKQQPDQSAAGTAFQAGELRISKKKFLHEFQKAALTPPRTYKAWFRDLPAEHLPDTIAYAFLDADFYESISDALRLVWPRLSKHGVITIDDYQQVALPGVERAVQEFFHDKTVDIHLEHHIAIIRT